MFSEWMLITLMFLLLYIFFGYPILLSIISALNAKTISKDNFEPFISIITAARNEEEVIKSYILNKLALDYPDDKYEIIIVSDESEDRTDEIIKEYKDKKIRYLRQRPREGKTAALNKAAQIARGEIFVFADANSIYETDTLKHLVKNFADSRVGYVTGKMVYVNDQGNLIGDGNTKYMKYENILRYLETRTGSVVGVDGGVDAVRKNLYEPMPVSAQPDFYLPLSVVENGYRVVYEPEAILKENALSQSYDEYKMRVRVSLRAMHVLWAKKNLLNIFRYGIFSFQLFSHKILRYLAGIFQIFAFIFNLILANNSDFWFIIFCFQLIFYCLTILAFFFEKVNSKSNPLVFLYYFNLLNLASTIAVVKFLSRKNQVLWNPRKG